MERWERHRYECGSGSVGDDGSGGRGDGFGGSGGASDTDGMPSVHGGSSVHGSEFGESWSVWSELSGQSRLKG